MWYSEVYGNGRVCDSRVVCGIVKYMAMVEYVTIVEYVA